VCPDFLEVPAFLAILVDPVVLLECT
jgi:hypothetical protein